MPADNATKVNLEIDVNKESGATVSEASKKSDLHIENNSIVDHDLIQRAANESIKSGESSRQQSSQHCSS